jgi:glutathione peroxidase-family protein
VRLHAAVCGPPKAQRRAREPRLLGSQSPVYAFLGKGGELPAWNFGKYLVGRDGKIVAYFPSKVAPDAKELRDAIEAALAR